MFRKYVSVLISLALSIGCSRQLEDPALFATRQFFDGKFLAAIKSVDQALPSTIEPLQMLRLRTLKGRCYLELAAQASQADNAAELHKFAPLAIEQFTHVIESPTKSQEFTYSDVYDFRRMAHELLADTDAANADAKMSRELDPNYQKAYLNLPRSELSEAAQRLLEKAGSRTDEPNFDLHKVDEEFASRATDEPTADSQKQGAEGAIEKLASDVLTSAPDGLANTPASKSNSADRDQGQASLVTELTKQNVRRTTEQKTFSPDATIPKKDQGSGVANVRGTKSQSESIPFDAPLTPSPSLRGDDASALGRTESNDSSTSTSNPPISMDPFVPYGQPNIPSSQPAWVPPSYTLPPTTGVVGPQPKYQNLFPNVPTTGYSSPFDGLSNPPANFPSHPGGLPSGSYQPDQVTSGLRYTGALPYEQRKRIGVSSDKVTVPYAQPSVSIDPYNAYPRTPAVPTIPGAGFSNLNIPTVPNSIPQ